MGEVDLEHFLEAESAGLPVDEGHRIDGEGTLHRCLTEQLLKQCFWMYAVLDLDDQVQAFVTVGEVFDVGDALQLFGLHELLDCFDDLFGADVVGGSVTTIPFRRGVADS